MKNLKLVLIAMLLGTELMASNKMVPETVCVSERQSVDHDIKVELLSDDYSWVKVLKVTVNQLGIEKVVIEEYIPLQPVEVFYHGGYIPERVVKYQGKSVALYLHEQLIGEWRVSGNGMIQNLQNQKLQLACKNLKLTED